MAEIAPEVAAILQRCDDKLFEVWRSICGNEICDKQCSEPIRTLKKDFSEVKLRAQSFFEELKFENDKHHRTFLKLKERFQPLEQEGAELNHMVALAPSYYERIKYHREVTIYRSEMLMNFILVKKKQDKYLILMINSFYKAPIQEALKWRELIRKDIKDLQEETETLLRQIKDKHELPMIDLEQMPLAIYREKLREHRDQICRLLPQSEIEAGNSTKDEIKGVEEGKEGEENI